MRIRIRNLSSVGEPNVMVFADDIEEARLDESIHGVKWEVDEGCDAAYVIMPDEPDLVEQLENEGYEVDATAYTPPGEDPVDN